MKFGFGIGLLIGSTMNVLGGMLIGSKPLVAVGVIGLLIGAALTFWPEEKI